LTALIVNWVACAATDKANLVLAVCGVVEESFTATVTAKLPLAVGVPERIPVVGARLSPAGRLPPEIDHV